jgi:pilus assembly protein CpaC
MNRAAYVCGRARVIGLATLVAAVLTQVLAGSAAWGQTSPTSQAMTLRKTIQQVKLTINESLGLEFVQPVKRAVIANDKIASISVISPKLVMITGTSFGFTQLVIWDNQDQQYVYDVRVDIDMRRLEQILKDAAPRAQIRVSTILDNVVLSGAVPDAATAERLISLAKVFASNVTNQLEIAGTQQVLLRATIAEISSDAVRSLGLNGTFFGAKAFGGSNLGAINPSNIGLPENTLIPIGLPNQFQIGPPGLQVSPTTTLYLGLPRAQMELFLRAMERDGLVRVLAEPTQVTLSGQAAEFLAGGELPIPTPVENGIAITFREFGIRLTFQPTVQSGQVIRLNVFTEVSEPDFTNAVQIAGYTVPGIAARRSKTVVEVGAGQTFAIAGLLSETMRGNIERVPGAGRLPILGALFRSSNYTHHKTELVIMVTPDLVAPLNPDQVTYLPGQDFQAPNDWQFYGLGLLQDDTVAGRMPASQPAQAPPMPRGPLYGPWGHEQNDGQTNSANLEE